MTMPPPLLQRPPAAAALPTVLDSSRHSPTTSSIEAGAEAGSALVPALPNAEGVISSALDVLLSLAAEDQPPTARLRPLASSGPAACIDEVLANCTGAHACPLAPPHTDAHISTPVLEPRSMKMPRWRCLSNAKEMRLPVPVLAAASAIGCPRGSVGSSGPSSE